jgi:hypothetical protein
VLEERPVSVPVKASESLEAEASIFFLFACGAFFALETLFHYESFVHSETLREVAPEALTLVIGSAIIAFIYFWMGYSCASGTNDRDRFLMAFCFSTILVITYFIVEASSSASSKFFYATYQNYAQFVTGYGSVTILAEMLVMFSTYRVATKTNIVRN